MITCELSRSQAVSPWGVVAALGAAIIAGLLPTLLKLVSSDQLVHWSTMQHSFHLLAFVCLIPVTLAMEGQHLNKAWEEATAVTMGVIFASSVFTFAGLWLQTWGFQNSRVGEAAMIALIEVPLAMVLQVVGFHAPCYASAGAGCFLVVLGGIINLTSVQLNSWLRPLAARKTDVSAT